MFWFLSVELFTSQVTLKVATVLTGFLSAFIFYKMHRHFRSVAFETNTNHMEMKHLQRVHQKCYQAAHLCLPDCPHWCICRWWLGMSGSSLFCLGGTPGHSSQSKMPPLQSCLHCSPAATMQSSRRIKASHTDTLQLEDQSLLLFQGTFNSIFQETCCDS